MRVEPEGHRHASTDTAWSYRETRWAQVVFGIDLDPAKAALIRSWAVDSWEAVHLYSTAGGGAYVNFMGEEGQERVRASYRDNYDRLTHVKAKYDPDNVFHVNWNIAPAN